MKKRRKENQLERRKKHSTTQHLFCLTKGVFLSLSHSRAREEKVKEKGTEDGLAVNYNVVPASQKGRRRPQTNHESLPQPSSSFGELAANYLKMSFWTAKKRPSTAAREKGKITVWMLRLFRSLSRFETQDIKTQPQFNHYLIPFCLGLRLCLVRSFLSRGRPVPFIIILLLDGLLKEKDLWVKGKGSIIWLVCSCLCPRDNHREQGQGSARMKTKKRTGGWPLPWWKRFFRWVKGKWVLCRAEESSICIPFHSWIISGETTLISLGIDSPTDNGKGMRVWGLGPTDPPREMYDPGSSGGSKGHRSLLFLSFFWTKSSVQRKEKRKRWPVEP